MDEEIAQFTKESLALSDNAAVKIYNEKVSALNSRVDDYEKRRTAFQKEADAFDVGLKKRPASLAQFPQPTSPYKSI
ncbi:MAG: hypothetical protein V1844_25170 [Pseudomonadota bacterium]